MDMDSQIVLFDGICNLCNGIVQFIIKRDPKGKFKFAALQSEAGQALLAKLGFPANYKDSIIYVNGNSYYRKSTAALKILKDLGGIWKLFYVFMILPRFIRNFFYDIIAKTRYTIFGARDSCMVPTPELKDRFLD